MLGTGGAHGGEHRRRGGVRDRGRREGGAGAGREEALRVASPFPLLSNVFAVHCLALIERTLLSGRRGRL
eukprot:3306438-Rhodomonas_salina.1